MCMQEVTEEFDCTSEQDTGTACHDAASQDTDVGIPPVPHPASELRMALLLADLQQPSDVRQPFWRDSRRLSLITEINQLRGLPGPRAAAMDVRQRNVDVSAQGLLQLAS